MKDHRMVFAFQRRLISDYVELIELCDLNCRD